MKTKLEFDFYVLQDNGDIQAILDDLKSSLVTELGCEVDIRTRGLFDGDNAQLAIDNDVFTVPSLVKVLPPPIALMVADLRRKGSLLYAVKEEILLHPVIDLP